MAISFRRYVDITSGVGAGVRVPGRQLIGRLFTVNPLAPSGTIITFTEAADVAAFFGSDSQEYKRAAFYFGWISKIQTRARAISFERWIREPVPATLRGTVAVPGLAEFQSIADGSLVLTINGVARTLDALNFTGATSYADVASAVQTVVRSAVAEPVYQEATVTFEAVTRTFTLTVGKAGATSISVASDAELGTPIANMLGWSEDAGGLPSNGADAMSITDTLNGSAGQDNNFGAFLFMGAELTTEEMREAATFSNLSNVGFLYCQRVTASEAKDVREALKGYDGVSLDEYNPAHIDQYPEMVPMTILAATDYTRRNGTQNYMFQQFALKPTVTDNAKADAMDALRINYYGRTQQAGQLIDFYQRGVLQGSVQDTNIYANEMWLKDRAGADIMTLMLALPKISANDTGRTQVLGALRNVVDMALTNGAISINKPLNYVQKTFITTITGDDTAWVQVQSQGYWLDAQIQEYTVDDRVEYKIVYLLVYAKDDVIRKVEGTHSLI